jgi:membrane-bound serine protease (ClpP class)
MRTFLGVLLLCLMAGAASAQPRPVVYVAAIEGVIDLGLAPFVERVLRVRTVAFVNKRAISAGALISLAAETIAMADGGTIGAATPLTTIESVTVMACNRRDPTLSDDAVRSE